jgi:hypothetical protein
LIGKCGHAAHYTGIGSGNRVYSTQFMRLNLSDLAYPTESKYRV